MKRVYILTCNQTHLQKNSFQNLRFQKGCWFATIIDVIFRNKPNIRFNIVTAVIPETCTAVAYRWWYAVVLNTRPGFRKGPGRAAGFTLDIIEH